MKCKIILFLLNLIGGRKNQENEEEKGRALGVSLFRKEMLMKRKWLIPIACFTLCLMMAGGAFAAKQVEKKANEPEAVAKPYLSGEAIAGAKLQIIDKDGKVIKEWISTEDTFEINAELEAGETYTLHEVSAPTGFLTAEDITFTVNEDGTTNELVMEDTPTTIYIEKKDKDTSNFVYNAVLQVKDEQGTVIDEWETDGKLHEIKGVLAAGGKYTVHEKIVPVGYVQSADVSFTVPELERPYTVTFYNVKDKDDVPKTGDGFPKLLIIGLAAIGLVGIGTILWLRKKL